MENEKSSCPLCHSAMRVNETWSPAYHLHSCQGCDIGVIRPIPSPEALAEYYSTTYVNSQKSKTAALQPVRVSEVRLIQRLIHRYKPDAVKICEVGCSNGWLLSALKEKGYLVKGYELSETTSALARSRGLDVETGEIPLDGSPAYDVVILRHVMEHTRDCIEFAKGVARIINPGGIAIFAVPNWKSLSAKILGQYWEWFMPPIHIWYFSLKNISLLMNIAGLEMLTLFTRQGDARPFVLETVLSYIRRNSLRRQNKQDNRSSSIMPVSHPSRLVAINSVMKSAILKVSNLLLLPMESLIAAMAFGPELWVAVRKPSHM